VEVVVSLPRLRLCLLALPLLAPLASADKPKSAEVVVPLVSMRGTTSVRDAVKDLQRQTGVSISDALGKDAPDVSLHLDRVSFWRAVDSLALAARAKPVQSGRDGSVVLQPFTRDDRRAPVSYDGPFRTRVTRISVSRELDSDRGGCVVALEVSWTPTLRPLFLESQPQKVTVRDGNGKDVEVADEGSSLAPVDGRFSLALEASLPALPREHKKITSLEGRLLAVAPTKMLRFGFENGTLAALDRARQGGEERKETREGVVCQVSKIVLGRDVWSVQVTLDYPEGNRKLESFQAAGLVANNELVLTGVKSKRKLLPSSSVIDQVGSRRAVVTHHFTDAKGAPRGKASDWTVSYTAPARVVEVPLRFSFEDLPLP
jgi:hypothetical protein